MSLTKQLSFIHRITGSKRSKVQCPSMNYEHPWILKRRYSTNWWQYWVKIWIIYQKLPVFHLQKLKAGFQSKFCLWMDLRLYTHAKISAPKDLKSGLSHLSQLVCIDEEHKWGQFQRVMFSTLWIHVWFNNSAQIRKCKKMRRNRIFEKPDKVE